MGSMASRTCRDCHRQFEPSSRHLACPACRSRTPCTCGNTKQKGSQSCRACRDWGWAFNGNWKGGRTRHKSGYVLVRVPDHPRARSSGYVFEHILVMEDLLGRFLLTDENVHHRNGVKDDNRPANLELWVRPHPPGIRAVEALSWARDIIRRYGDMDTSNNARDRS